MFLTCPMGKWCFLRNSNDRGNVKSILLVNSFFVLVEMMAGVVNASFSLPEGQAVKMIFSAPCSLCWEFAFIPKSGMKSLFIRIDSSSHTADSSAKVITSFMSLFLPVYLFFCHGYFFFQIDCLEPSFTDSVSVSVSVSVSISFSISVSVSVSEFRIPCFSAAVIIAIV